MGKEEEKMKRMIVFLLLTCLLSTTCLAAGNFETSARQTAIPVEINANNLPLADLLQEVSEQCGVRLLAAPEVGGIKIDLHITAHQTLDKVLEALEQKYHLAFTFNEKKNVVVVYQSSYAPNKGTLWMRMRLDMSENASLNVPSLPPPAYYPPVFNTEDYKKINDNNYQTVTNSPVSTFSIDVDTASYSNVRRFINSGKLPPVDAVRTEEMINYFTYEYPQPRDGQPFSVTMEVSACPWQPKHQMVLVGLQGKNLAKEELPPSNLVFLIDVSGSMADSKKLPLLKSSFKMLVKELRAEDKISIVVYAGQAGVVLEPTSGRDKEKIIAAIDRLEAGGSTAGGEGIKLAYNLARQNFLKNGNNRVILATDGDFNVGVSSEGELTRMIENECKDGIFLSVIGVGEGNLKDSKMEALADKGNGNYSYIDNMQEAKKVLVGQMAGTLFTIAKDVKLQVEFNPAKVKAYRLIGYENRKLDRQDFNDDKKDAGDMGAGHSVTALYEIIPAGSPEETGSVDPLTYQKTEVVNSDELMKVKIRYKKPNEDTSNLMTKAVSSQDITADPSRNFRFSAAVAEYAMLLRNSEFKGQSSYQAALELAKSAKGRDEAGYRSEFIRLVEVSEMIDER